MSLTLTRPSDLAPTEPVSTRLGDYLTTRRSLVTPEDIGVRRTTDRRVAGLRRDEVARVAGVSKEYYLRLEQGRNSHPSDQVLRALARALRLDSYAVEYMKKLMALDESPSSTLPVSSTLDPDSYALPHSLAGTPAYTVDGSHTVISSTASARDLMPMLLQPGSNIPEGVFSAEWRSIDLDWETTARRSLAAWRFDHDPRDPLVRETVDSLRQRDADFRRLWARHDASPHYFATGRFNDPTRGTISYTRRSFLIPGQARTLVLLST